MFQKYCSIENFYREKFIETALTQFPELLKEDYIITEKIHGCLHADSRILLADGSYEYIRNVVDNKLDVEVLGMDKDGKIVPTKILNYFVNGKTKDWRKVIVERFSLGSGPAKSVIHCTPNHKFYSPVKKDYVECDSLQVGDEVLMCRNQPELSFVEQQVIIGKMLGDAYYNHKQRYMTFGHKKSHEEYLEYTSGALKRWIGNQQKDQRSGYGTQMCRTRTVASPVIQEFLNPWVKDEVKVVPGSIIGKLSPIALAFWYMDDGSLSHHKDQEDRANFATCGFNEEDIDNILAAMGFMDIDANKKIYDGYWRITLDSYNANKLFTLIAPYMPPLMQYKLPEYYRHNNCVEIFNHGYRQFYRPQKILNIEKYTPFCRFKKYDIETGTHNFFVNNVLVHNSHTALVFAPGKALTVCSRNRLLSEQDSHFNVRQVLEDECQELVERFAQYAEDTNQVIALHGELFGPGVQKGVNYGNKKQIRIFDMRIDGAMLSQKAFLEVFYKLSLFEYIVPVIKVVTGLEAALECNIEFDSNFTPLGFEEPNICEGIVIKPYNKVYILGNGSTFYLKKKNEKFSENGRGGKPAKERRSFSDEAHKLREAFLSLINKNRVESVFSKEGEIETPQEMGKYIKLVIEDAMIDLIKDHGEIFHALEKKERKYALNAGKEVVVLLREYL